MHCMDHGHAIHRVKACSSFPWIKQSTHLSVERPQGGDFQRKSLKLRYPTDRYKCTSSAHALHGSLVRHSWCQSVLIIPLDQAIHPLVRCKNRNSIRLAAPGGGFSTAKSEITLSNGQIQVRKQHTCIVWITDTPSIV